MPSIFTDRTATTLARIAREYQGNRAMLRPTDRIEPRGGALFRNDSTETVPAYGCMRVTGAEDDEGRYVIVIGKPDGTGGPFVFNGPAEVEAGENGQCFTAIVRAKFSGGSPTAGDIWGPESDWAITSAGDDAITIFGSIETDTVLGNASGGGGGSTIYKGVMDEDIAPGETKTVSIWTSAGDTGNNAEVVFDHIDEETISTGKEVFFYWAADEGQFQMLGAACEDPEQIPTLTAASNTLTAATSARVQFIDASSNDVDVTLPQVSGNNNLQYHLVRIDSSANTVTIDGNASETINGQTTAVLTGQYSSITPVTNGTEWIII